MASNKPCISLADIADDEVLGHIRRTLLNARLVREAREFDREASGQPIEEIKRIAYKYVILE